MNVESITTDGAVQLHVPVTGMHCSGCAARLQKALDTVPGLASVNVELALEKAHFDADDADAVRRAADMISGNGFTVGDDVFQLEISGMHCGNCAGRIEQALLVLPGVLSANVNAASESARIEAVAGAVTLRQIIAGVEAAGYQATAQGGSADERDEARRAADAKRAADLRRDTWLLIGAALLTAPLVLPMVLGLFGVGGHLSGWWQLALATPVQIFIGARFYRGAWAALKNGAANMDVLVALGTSAAFFYSTWLVFRFPEHADHIPLYFEASAVVLTLVMAGKLLEARAKRSASAAIRSLMDLRPRTAMRLADDGSEEEVGVDALAVGDRVVVRPGGRIPADGIIKDGSSELDESLVTGESVPVLRQPGDRIIEGAINGTGRLEVDIAAVGADTTLARVIRMVEQAQAGKAPVQRLVDRIAAIFVPVVLVIAAITFGGWLLIGQPAGAALSAAVAVLVIACPCALGLATPAALVAGTGAAARAGILIKDIEALEHLARVDTVVFDKTGTLTEGKPAVVQVAAFGRSEDELLTIAASVLSGSEHPLAKAIVAHTGANIAGDVSDFENVPGAGVSAIFDGTPVLIGRPNWLAERGVDLATGAEALDTLHEQAQTPVAVAVDGELAGVIALADTLRAGASDAVADLAVDGVESLLLSGDAKAVAKAIAAKAGITKVMAEVNPAEKAQTIADLGRDGKYPAMVGDGVNDAAALAAADVGIAMGGGTDVAMETAAVTLMRSDPRLVASARRIAQRTARTIKQNLFWAFAYNVIGIPLAALGLLSPAFAGAAMALSSVTVVGNALRLTRWKPALSNQT